MEGVSAAELLYLHARLAARLGCPAGVASTDALRAALAQAGRDTGGLFERAAALAIALIRERPFRAANEALALAAAALLLRRYGLDVALVPGQMAGLAALLLRGEVAELANWLRVRVE
ncbi:MAG: hypothetical protein IRZ14_11705 [Chloroflexi bacterium]|nr:hypothetical protein [Chloroflexota bacterium]